ncbi:MAG: DUF2793 domain-containing protein [Acidobacteriota bacterium]
MAFKDITEITESQAAKYLTANEAFRKLRILSGGGVITDTLATPPGSPAVGDSYIVAVGGTGAWTGWDHKLVFWSGAGWTVLEPDVGWATFVASSGGFKYWGGSAWLPWGEQAVNSGDITFRPMVRANAKGGALPPLGTFTRASAATRINSRGSIEVMPAGVLRRDYDPVTGKLLGYLIEESRTRLNTIAAAPTAAENVTVTAQAYTISFYGTGSVALSGAHTATVAGVGAFPTRTTYTFTPAAGTLTMTPSGSVSDLQFEAGPFATSVIRGEGASQTRAADLWTATLASLLNDAGNPTLVSTEGAFFVEFDFTGFQTSTSIGQAVIGIDDGTTSNRIAINRSVTAGLFCPAKSGGAAVGGNQVLVASPVLNTTYKVMLSWGPTGRSASLNGGTIVSDATAFNLSSTILNIGSLASGTAFLNGHIKRAYVWSRRPSDADVQTQAAS